MDKWTIESAESVIIRNRGNINRQAITITFAGLRVLGAIDYLVNYCGYNRR